MMKLIEQAKKGELPIYFTSEPRPTEQDPYVLKVVGRTLKEYTQINSKPILLDIYSPRCGHCKEL